VLTAFRGITRSNRLPIRPPSIASCSLSEVPDNIVLIESEPKRWIFFDAFLRRSAPRNLRTLVAIETSNPSSLENAIVHARQVIAPIARTFVIDKRRSSPVMLPGEIISHVILAPKYSAAQTKATNNVPHFSLIPNW